jgi:uncharacterized membrane protein
MATAHLTTTQAAGESLGDWVLQLGAMVGAPAGALAGVTIAGDLAGGVYAAVLGTLGTIVGSPSCALAGKYLVLPMWAATLGLSKR